MEPIVRMALTGRHERITAERKSASWGSSARWCRRVMLEGEAQRLAEAVA